MRKTVIALLLIIQCFWVYAQNLTISGYVRDKHTGESLINANVYEKESMKGTITNEYGFFSLSLSPGEKTIVFSYVGYTKEELNVNLQNDSSIVVELELMKELHEVKVYGSEASKVKRTQMSMVEIPTTTLAKVPLLLGEPDVLKVIQLLPGVQSGTEGTSGIYVRGGGPDQNLFLLDGVPVYNANHLFGFFSVFNPSAVKTVKLYKGGFPARFGGRLSSVIDIRMKEGNTKEFKGEFSVGLISSRFSLEGPIVKDKTSFIVSGRRTYLDLLARPVMKIVNKNTDGYDYTGGYYFYDLNAKINHIFSDRSRLYFSSYLGLDKAYSVEEGYYVEEYVRYNDRSESGLKWGNITNALRWNYVFGSKLFSNVTLTYSKYNFNVGSESLTVNTRDNEKREDIFDYNSGIEDFAGRIDFDYFPSARHSVKMGIGAIHHTFSPGVNHYNFTDDSDSAAPSDTTFGNKNIAASEIRMYGEDVFDISEKFQMNVGAHFSFFNVQGRNYTSFEPRASLRFLGSEKWSLKASYAQMSQYIHLLTTSTISLPTDLWLPATKNVKPQMSHQVAVGAFYKLPKGFDLSAELFYKDMNNLIEYKEGASFSGVAEGWESKIETGRGWAYGLEVMLEKNIGKTTGWIGYTLSKSERKFENLNFGKAFPAKYDRRHDVSLVLTHRFSDKIDVGATWVYGTGNAVTLGQQTYAAGSTGFSRWGVSEIQYYGGRNNYRMPAYHRLDVGVNFHKQKKHGIRTWSLGVYNAYSRQNPFYLFWGHNSKSGYNEQGKYYETSETALKQLSLFPLIPSVSYTFKF
ncbi:Outer membrane receptor for ferrienterochelin and colicins [Mariniphaga anaerophila]|uniref:Outer membrane receptor for ferrienterochelin and colicins n=1 Tax=Mariniphaga anaerophila TaxID=1484053 RepID=A0A1M5DK19_9BACT|nr:TonB-dependent receptor [Mariniphaga anaerophila]SHF67368.1 Outer membrane receptor for ferrienterochelin and colicins [Mariniphaga anaerophila]